MSETNLSPLKPGRSRMSGEQKDKIRAEQLARRLYKFANAKGKQAQKYAMSQAQVTAAKALIDKGKPSLQAVESTVVDPNDAKTEAELTAEFIERVRALFRSNPEVMRQLNVAWKPSEASSEEQKRTAA